ncbi:ParB/RepB/Spo0J family partition protein [Vibrio scophthalmi]|uniref:ParB-like N-terminal domain-containing protein n=1 Tax=Vibrio scophthalmi TaxID=45658 RepID=A0A1C7FHD1_9VIBR|nr:ParB/RepB/Spo0J family partition protein [Vibrio scophthalmi]ANU39485.1 hypothetical protein VSVS05_04450 [Vibrio scophthalmi]
MSLRDRAQGITMDDILDESAVKLRSGKGQYLSIPKDSIYSGKQIRKRFEPKSIEEMGLSLEINGQEQPIVVSPLDSKGYKIQKGERRWRGAMSNPNVTHLDCIIRSDGDILGQITENIQREDLDPIELSEAFHEAKKTFTFNNRQLAQKLGKTEAYISKYLSVIKAPSFVLDAFEKGIIGDVESINELRKAAEIDKDKTQRLLSSTDLVSREDAIKFKKQLSKAKGKEVSDQLNQTSPLKSPKQNVTSILVQVNNRQGLVFASGKYSDQLTILFDDGELEQVVADDVRLIGYRL